MSHDWSVVVLWRGDEDARRAGIASNERLRHVFQALAEVGIEAHPVVHRDEVAASVRDELLAVDGVLVWIDPIGRGEDRRCIDSILREVAASGAEVTAHPDVIAAMGTKEVLHRTRELGPGTDVHRYDTLEALHIGLRAGLPAGPRVLKPRYGNGGIGVWKVELVQGDETGANVRVQGAEQRDTTVEYIRLGELLDRCAPAFNDGGCVVDQPFQPRITEGMIPYDRQLSNLIGELSTRSHEFRVRWAAHDVRIHTTGAKRFHHPVVGDLELAFDTFPLGADPGQTLLTYTAEPGSRSHDALNLLASWSATTDNNSEAPSIDEARKPETVSFEQPD